MTAHPKVTLVTCSSMPHLFPGEEGLLDELASRGCDPQIKVWNDPDVDWSEAGMVVVRSVSDYASDRQAFLDWTRQLTRVQNSKDVLNWNTDKHYLRDGYAPAPGRHASGSGAAGQRPLGDAPALR